jgi:calcium binding protein 39
MAFLFGKSKAKSPSELVKNLKETLVAFDKKDIKEKDSKKAQEAIGQDLAQMKFVLYGDAEHPVNQESVNQLYEVFQSSEVLRPLITHMTKYDFEAKKELVIIFNNVLRRQVGNTMVTVQWLEKNPNILLDLVRGYDVPDIALNCGAMLRECLRYENLTKIVLHSPELYNFFKYVEVSNFDLASDAFKSLKELLSKHKTLCAEFLEVNYDKLFGMYTQLLTSENYATRRQSLKLLGELLLDRANFSIMSRYIGSAENLKLMMTLLRDKKRTIQFEAFHVFKVFVANPKKTTPILEILVMNKDKLIVFLNNFHNDKEDEQFNEEKNFLLKQIAALTMPSEP